MSTSLSSPVDNLSDGLHNIECADCKSNCDYMINKDDQLIFRCFACKKNYKKDFDKELIRRFSSTYIFFKANINKFVLLLRKGVYSFEYIYSWECFEETEIPSKEDFYSSLYMENITDIDYRLAKRVFTEFKISLTHYYLPISVKPLEICVLIHISLTLHIF